MQVGQWPRLSEDKELKWLLLPPPQIVPLMSVSFPCPFSFYLTNPHGCSSPGILQSQDLLFLGSGTAAAMQRNVEEHCLLSMDDSLLPSGSSFGLYLEVEYAVKSQQTFDSAFLNSEPHNAVRKGTLEKKMASNRSTSYT